MTDPIDILLVDDEPRNLDALEAILDKDGYRLLRAEDADRALRILLDHAVAAIVLDIKMPRVNGIELARIIKGTKRFRQVPILFLTAHMVDDTDIITGYGVGAVDYLTKPFNPQILRHKVGVYADLFHKTRAIAELNERLEQRVVERTAELEKSELALRAAARQKDEFLATLAHELRNPLVPLRTGLDLLMQTAPTLPSDAAGTPSSKQALITGRTLAAMNRQLDHIVRLIDDLLDVSRISSGVFELKLQPTNLAALIENTTETNQALLEQKSITLTVNALPHVEAVVDPTRISQILGNLLHNASKFTPPNGQIQLKLEEESSEIVIRVIDTGVGIAEEQLEHVFEMFARVDGESLSSDRGTGIGLALARRLAQMHGGDLSAWSAGKGLGATFTLRIPRCTSVLAAPVHPLANHAPITTTAIAPRNILVIEDNVDVADTLAALLTGLGHQVAVARSGTEGIDLIQRQRPQLVLCDIGLPEMDGNEVCRRVREIAVDFRPTMVAVTGWGQEADRKRTRAAGFDRHLVKPVTLDMLREVLL